MHCVRIEVLLLNFLYGEQVLMENESLKLRCQLLKKTSFSFMNS